MESEVEVVHLDLETQVGETNSSTRVYAAINNIPSFYHSSDLRRFFSQVVETGGFDCFHFRHRPEKQSSKCKTSTEQASKQNITSTNSSSCKSASQETFCCIVRLSQTKFVELTRSYHQRRWLNRKGESTGSKCLISKLKVSTQSSTGVSSEAAASDSATAKYQTRGEQRLVPPEREDFKEEDLMKLPELRPPTVMPNGNVGTPTAHFLKLIQECRLPPSIITKLQLDFPNSKGKGKYGSVPYNYDTALAGCTHRDVSPDNDKALNSSVQAMSGENQTGSDHSETDRTKTESKQPSTEKDIHESQKSQVEEDETAAAPSYKELRKIKKRAKRERKRLMAENIEEKMIAFEQARSDSGEDNDSCEEWERHEAMYDDVSNQGRDKDRLFEEEMEVVWEKGGSGLVFYTDAQYWHEKEGDFDEQTTDDLDVDMSAYYETGAGDPDIRDFLTIRQEQRRRRGIDKTDRFSAGIGKFERHTKGFGRKIMEKQGWTEGAGLGSSVQGIADALENDGKRPRDRSGFGYRGEKLVMYGHSAAKKKKRDVLISTIYDDPSETDALEPLHRRNSPGYIKHRDRIN